MITRIYKAETLVKQIQVIVNANSIEQHVVRIKNGIIKHFNVSVKILAHANNIIVGILVYVLVRKVSIYKVLLMNQ